MMLQSETSLQSLAYISSRCTIIGHVPEIDSAAGTLAGLLCIGGIGGLSSQSTARLGAASGQAGVALGLASTLGHLHPDFATTAKMATLMGIGGEWLFRIYSCLIMTFGTK